MRNSAFAILILLLINILAFAGEDAPAFTKLCEAIFHEHVENGLVNYGALQKSPQRLNKSVNLLTEIDPKKFTDRNKELAFWINAYNILVLHSIVAAYPIKSPMDVKGFFDRKKHPVGSEKLTLNEIENKKIRAKFKDARIHFVLVCAARSCPILISNAYLGDTVDAQLDARAKATLNDPKYVRVDAKAGKVYMSEIFRWYKEDFINGKKSVIDYVNQYRTEKIPQSYSVDYIHYDWTLNDSKLKI